MWNIFAAFSLLLCVATTAIGVRSFWITDTISWSQPGLSIGAGCFKGILWLGDYRMPNGMSLGTGWDYRLDDAPAGDPIADWASDDIALHRFAGFGFAYGTKANIFNATIRAIGIPCWFIVLLSAIPPAAWIRRWRTIRRGLREGCCQNCGYNLTANLSGVCPECGTPIASAPDKPEREQERTT
jgi:hypothetical protein